MDRLLLALKKPILIPVVALGWLIAWLVLCHAHYVSYWLGTIYRVQTTDFNLLHHTLPTTLSQLIREGRDDSIQKVLDSNFGLFGLVVTDPSGQTIVYQTKSVYHLKTWQLHASPEDMAEEKEPFDYLTDPPPLETVWQHDSPRDGTAHQVSEPKGKILGRLYYVRPAPPTFLGDLSSFLTSGFWELSGSKRGYLLVTFLTIGFSLVVLLLVWLRQSGIEIKHAELLIANRELEIRRKALETLSSELSAQKTRKAWLEKESDHAYKRALALKHSLERLKEALSVPSEVLNQGRNGTPSVAKVRPPVHPPSAILEELEDVVPELAQNAEALRSQAELLQDYCGLLEERQMEMRKIVDHAFPKPVQNADQLIDMSPR